MLISSPDLVLAVSRKGKKFGAKNRGRGEGREWRKRDLVNFDRVGQD